MKLQIHEVSRCFARLPCLRRWPLASPPNSQLPPNARSHIRITIPGDRFVAQQVSRDGKFVAYAYMPQDGDGEIVVRNIATGVDWRAPRGYRPPVPPPDDPGTNIAEFQAEQARLLRPVFTADSRFLIFGTEPTKAELNKAKKEKKKPEDMPKNGLSIMDLSNGTVTRVERVKTFRVPEDGSGFFAYQLEPKPEEKPRARRPDCATEPHQTQAQNRAR